MPIQTNELIDSIVEAVRDKKGSDITIMDLSETDGASTQAFVVCTGRSTSQVSAIADSVSERVRKELNDKPVNIHGYRNAQWVILDYGAVMVHIFLPETRQYYDLEGLWSDAPSTRIPDLD